MLGIIGIIILLTVLGLSLVITRLAAVALSMTGLSREEAVFQARSAFTGTGFTTTESEDVVNHPVRRRIITLLMILRSAGLVTIIISILLSFMGSGEESDVLLRLLLLIVGVGALLLAAHLPIVNIGLERVMEWALRRWTRLNVRDYIRLLNLAGEYTVTEMHVEQGDWVEGKQLQQCDLGNEGVTVLGIRREDGSYVGAPRGSTNIHPGDVLVLYGRSEPLENLDKRREGGAGDAAHEQAKQEQQQEMARQDAQEQQHEQKRQQDTAESLAGPAGRNRKHAP